MSEGQPAYRIEIEQDPAEALRKIPNPDRTRIGKRIRSLADDPRPAGATKLVGLYNSYRVRQGNYRIVYIIEDSIRIVRITRIGHRKDVYKEM